MRQTQVTQFNAKFVWRLLRVCVVQLRTCRTRTMGPEDSSLEAMSNMLGSMCLLFEICSEHSDALRDVLQVVRVTNTDELANSIATTTALSIHMSARERMDQLECLLVAYCKLR